MRINIPIAITIIVLVGGAAFFVFGGPLERQQRMSGEIYSEMRLKVNYAPTGEVKLFASVPERYLKPYDAAEGSNLPTDTAMVIGSAEAQMMKDEKLITGTGDSFDDFFGIRTSVGGILTNTSTLLDELHFLGAQQYASIQGEENRVFVLRTEEGMPKLFYRKGADEQTPLKFDVAEGSAGNYKVQTFEGKSYQPILIGSAEAAMMKEEKLFEEPGDRIDGFFGRDVVIAGVLVPTNTSVDMMHILPLGKDELSE